MEGEGVGWEGAARVITILSLSPISSSSSFFLCSKWTSIRVCSSRRSFSILFLWMSWERPHNTQIQASLMLFVLTTYSCDRSIIEYFKETYIKVDPLAPLRDFRGRELRDHWPVKTTWGHINVYVFRTAQCFRWQTSVFSSTYLYLGRSSSTWQPDQQPESELMTREREREKAVYSQFS